jgi:hypothetical protein
MVKKKSREKYNNASNIFYVRFDITSLNDAIARGQRGSSPSPSRGDYSTIVRHVDERLAA